MRSAPDNSVPFALAGQVRAWDPINRWLWIGDIRLSLPPKVSLDDFILGQSVIAIGYKARDPAGGPGISWVVTDVRRSRVD